MKNRAVLCFVLVILSGLHVGLSHASRAPRPRGEVHPDKALVYFVAMRGGNYWFSSEEFLTHNNNKTYSFVHLEPGSHVLWTLVRSTMEVELKAGATYFLVYWHSAFELHVGENKDYWLDCTSGYSSPDSKRAKKAEKFRKRFYPKMLKASAKNGRPSVCALPSRYQCLAGTKSALSFQHQQLLVSDEGFDPKTVKNLYLAGVAVEDADELMSAFPTYWTLPRLSEEKNIESIRLFTEMLRTELGKGGFRFVSSPEEADAQLTASLLLRKYKKNFENPVPTTYVAAVVRMLDDTGRELAVVVLRQPVALKGGIVSNPLHKRLRNRAELAATTLSSGCTSYEPW